MNVAQLVEKLDRVQGLRRLERRVAYGEALEFAKQLFPELSVPIERHKRQLEDREQLSPLDGADRETFKCIFEQVPGLSKAYGAATASLYAGYKPSVQFLPDQTEYWGAELRFDSDLGRQL